LSWKKELAKLKTNNNFLMKDIFALIVSMSVCGPTLAQWLPNGATTGNIYYTNGNVGIGTTMPTAKLEVAGTGHFTGRLAVQATISGDNSAAFWNHSETGYGLYSQGGGPGKYSFHFLTQTGSTILYGGSNGNIGIGAYDVNAKLKIVNSSAYNSNETGVGQDHILLNGTMPGTGGYYGGITWEGGARRRASIVATQENEDHDYVGLAFSPEVPMVRDQYTKACVLRMMAA
jgi:hypothetical protein